MLIAELTPVQRGRVQAKHSGDFVERRTLRRLAPCPGYLPHLLAEAIALLNNLVLALLLQGGKPNAAQARRSKPLIPMKR